MKFSFTYVGLLINTTLLNSKILHKSVDLAKMIDFPLTLTLNIQQMVRLLVTVLHKQHAN